MQKPETFPRRVRSLLAALLIVTLLVGACPMTAFAGHGGGRIPVTTAPTEPVTRRYCFQYASCRGGHYPENCPGLRGMTPTTSNATIGGVDYTMVTTVPTATALLTTTVSAPNKDVYTYTVSADQTTMTEYKNGVANRTAKVADYVNTSTGDTSVHATRSNKKAGIYKYQGIGDATVKMNIWIGDGTKTAITRTKTNTSDYFDYQNAVDGNAKAHKAVVGLGIGTGVAVLAIAVAAFATAGLAGAAAAAIGAKIGAAIIAGGTVVGGGAVSGLAAALEACNTTYANAKKYYYLLKG